MIKDKAFYREFFSLYVMLVLQNVIVLGVNLADNIMIGSYSETALSGVAAVNQIQFVFQQIIMGCGDAIVVLGSQYWGQKRCPEVNKISFSAMTLALSAAVILFAFALFIPGKVVGIFTPTEAIVASGVEYINIIKYTYIIFAITNVLLATLRCVETVKIAFLVSLATLFINCSINFVLIEGRFGFPELGVTGAAIGTLTARIIELVIVIIYVAFYDKKLKIKLSEYIKIDKKLYWD
ncbi:MAG: MATE family efflux transporter, partial [Clostridia bacterium]|nr:MATE family efflux transporter [Clostridia bacterium]